MTPQSVIALLLASTICLHAAPRLWKTSNGSVSGEFVNRDATTVTIRFGDGKEVISPLANLHPTDLTWVNAMHPLAAPDKGKPDKGKPDQNVPDKSVPDKSAVFDRLLFGDTREQVLAKLKASKFVELTVGETFLGRTGLNGVFRLRKKIGELDASLYFDWTDAGVLKELTLQTDALPSSDYQTKLEPCWKDFIVLLSTLYGTPLHQGSMPNIATLTDGSFSPSHLWTLEGGGSALLGTARDGDNYQLVVRFKQQKTRLLGMP